MGEQIERLEEHIAEQRAELGDNLESLATKAKTMTDWRSQFQKRPVLGLALAVGGGMVLSSMLRGRRRPAAAAPAENGAASAPSKRQAHGMMEDLRVALGAVAAANAVSFLSSAIPGFKSHFEDRASAETA